MLETIAELVSLILWDVIWAVAVVGAGKVIIWAFTLGRVDPDDSTAALVGLFFWFFVLIGVVVWVVKR